MVQYMLNLHGGGGGESRGVGVGMDPQHLKQCLDHLAKVHGQLKGEGRMKKGVSTSSRVEQASAGDVVSWLMGIIKEALVAVDKECTSTMISNSSKHTVATGG